MDFLPSLGMEAGRDFIDMAQADWDMFRSRMLDEGPSRTKEVPLTLVADKTSPARAYLGRHQHREWPFGALVDKGGRLIWAVLLAIWASCLSGWWC